MEKVIEIGKWVVAMFTSFLMSVVGGGDTLVILMLSLVVADLVFGALKGIKNKVFSSSILFWGIVNKAILFCIIAIMYRVDLALGIDILRNTFIMWFCICDGASIIENTAIIGIPWPDGLLKVLVQVRKGFSINISKIVTKIIEEYNVSVEESEKKEHE